MSATDKPKPQFFRVGSSLVKDGALRGMTAVDLKVYMVLALHANWTTGKCWPSYKTIRTLSGCSFDCIATATRRLVGLGTISISKEKGKKGRRNVYTVFRTLRPSPGTRSDGTEYPPTVKQKHNKRDALGRYRSDGTEAYRSERTEDPHSDGTEQNEIYINESDGIRSKSFEANERHSLISPETFKKLEKERGRAWTLAYAREHNYPIPEELLRGEETNAASPETQVYDPQAPPDQEGRP